MGEGHRQNVRPGSSLRNRHRLVAGGVSHATSTTQGVNNSSHRNHEKQFLTLSLQNAGISHAPHGVGQQRDVIGSGTAASRRQADGRAAIRNIKLRCEECATRHIGHGRKDQNPWAKRSCVCFSRSRTLRPFFRSCSSPSRAARSVGFTVWSPVAPPANSSDARPTRSLWVTGRC